MVPGKTIHVMKFCRPTYQKKKRRVRANTGEIQVAPTLAPMSISWLW